MPALADKSKFLIIRLVRWGCTNRPFYHIVVAKNRHPRNARPIDTLGTFDPMKNLNGELLCTVNYQRLLHYLAKNTQLSKSAAQLLGYSGFLPPHPSSYVKAKRNRIKAAQKEEESKALGEDGEKSDLQTQEEVNEEQSVSFSDAQSEVQVELQDDTPPQSESLDISQSEVQGESSDGASQSGLRNDQQSETQGESKSEAQGESNSEAQGDSKSEAQSENKDNVVNNA